MPFLPSFVPLVLGAAAASTAATALLKQRERADPWVLAALVAAVAGGAALVAQSATLAATLHGVERVKQQLGADIMRSESQECVARELDGMLDPSSSVMPAAAPTTQAHGHGHNHAHPHAHAYPHPSAHAHGADALTPPDAVAIGSAGAVVLSSASLRRKSTSPPDAIASLVAPPPPPAAIASATALSIEGNAPGTASTRVGPVIVGVGGASGSGKTSIAELIAARLTPLRVASLSSDNYYKTLPADADPSDYNFDHPSAIDFDLLAEHLSALRRGGDARIPHYDFVSHARTREETVVRGCDTDVLILDGILVLYVERVRALCDLTLFTAEDSDVCLARRLRRDIVARGRTVDSVLVQYLRFVKAGFTQFVAPSMTLADVIIPRARDNVVAIDMLARDLQRRVECMRAVADAGHLVL